MPAHRLQFEDSSAFYRELADIASAGNDIEISTAFHSYSELPRSLKNTLSVHDLSTPRAGPRPLDGVFSMVAAAMPSVGRINWEAVQDLYDLYWGGRIGQWLLGELFGWPVTGFAAGVTCISLWKAYWNPNGLVVYMHGPRSPPVDIERTLFRASTVTPAILRHRVSSDSEESGHPSNRWGRALENMTPAHVQHNLNSRRALDSMSRVHWHAGRHGRQGRQGRQGRHGR
mmetsp:Transcript_58910/g.117888  ORF Transcript_58910/g.117888 Transcript_58910/m.117888 type:complete len:229 (-) Transcript_58910:103-789(-)